LPSAPDISSGSALHGPYQTGLRSGPLGAQQPFSGLAGSLLVLAVGLYLIGLLLLHVAFAYSTNPALREALFGFLALRSPVAAASRGAVFFVLGVACLFAGHALLLNGSSVAFGNRRQGTVWGMLALLSLLYVSLPPFLSTDVLSYYQQGWLIVEKGTSPYITPPGAYGEFPGMRFMKGQNYWVLSPYGPLWSQVEALVYRVTGGSLWLGVAVFKLLAAGSVWLLAYLVWAILQRSDPANATRGALLVGTNPLLLVEGAGMAHNDVVALAVAFVGLALVHRGGENRTVAGLALIGVSLLIKALAAVVPFALAVYWIRVLGLKRLLRLAFKAALLWVPVAVASGMAFVNRPADVWLLFGSANARLPYEIRYTPVNTLRDELVQHSASIGVPLDPVHTKVVLLVVAFGGVVAFMIFLLARARTLFDALKAVGPGYIGVTVAASYWRQWYAAWPVPFVALGQSRLWTGVAIAYSAGALLTLTQ
jgi:hypothetical protein